MSLARKIPRWSAAVAAVLCVSLAIGAVDDAAAQPRPASQPRPEGERQAVDQDDIANGEAEQHDGRIIP